MQGTALGTDHTTWSKVSQLVLCCKKVQKIWQSCPSHQKSINQKFPEINRELIRLKTIIHLFELSNATYFPFQGWHSTDLLKHHKNSLIWQNNTQIPSSRNKIWFKFFSTNFHYTRRFIEEMLHLKHITSQEVSLHIVHVNSVHG